MEYDIYGALEPLGFAVVWGDFDEADGFPRVTLQRISTVTAYSLKQRMDVEGARVQVNVFAETYEQTMLAANQISQTLTSFRGGSVIRCKELSRRDSCSEAGGDVIRLQQLDFWVRYRA